MRPEDFIRPQAKIWEDIKYLLLLCFLVGLVVWFALGPLLFAPLDPRPSFEEPQVIEHEVRW